MVPDHGTWGHRYWLIWAGVTFLSFIGPEVYALVSYWHNTLSASVWDMERFMPGQRGFCYSGSTCVASIGMGPIRRA